MTIKTESLTLSGGCSAYFAAASEGKVPGVIVIQEIFGVNVYVRSVVERLAAAGYAALAPDLFWRTKPGIELGYTPEDIARGRELKNGLQMDQVIGDVRAAFDSLRRRPECRDRKVGIIGFCYGGLITYLAATRLDPACASCFYGGGIADYLGEAERLGCPIQFHFGSQDTAIPMDQVERIRRAVQGRDAEVFVYKGVGHGFHCDRRGSYDAAAAKLAWQRSLDFFGKHLA